MILIKSISGFVTMCFVLMYYQLNSTKTIMTVMWDSVEFFRVKNGIIFENLGTICSRVKYKEHRIIIG